MASDKLAVGAKVFATATIRGKTMRQLRLITASDGDQTLVAHFGLGDATKVDLLRIEWPIGVVQELTVAQTNGVSPRPGGVKIASWDSHHDIDSQWWVAHLIEVAGRCEVLFRQVGKRGTKLPQGTEHRPGVRKVQRNPQVQVLRPSRLRAKHDCVPAHDQVAHIMPFQELQQLFEVWAL